MISVVDRNADEAREQVILLGPRALVRAAVARLARAGGPETRSWVRGETLPAGSVAVLLADAYRRPERACRRARAAAGPEVCLVVAGIPASGTDAMLHAGADDVIVGPLEAAALRTRLAVLRHRAALPAGSRFETLVATLAEGVVIQGADNRVHAWNAAAEEILGLGPGMLGERPLSSPSWDIVQEDGTPLAPEDRPARQTLKTGQPQLGVIMGVRQPDGGQAWVSVNTQPLRHRSGEPPYAVLVSITDVTGRKLFEDALREQERFLSAIFDNAPVSIFVFDGEGTLRRTNEAGQRFLATDPSRAGEGEYNVFARERLLATRVAQDVRRAFAGEVVDLRAVPLSQAPAGPERYYDATLFPVPGPAGKIEAVVAFATDVTVRVGASDALRESEERFRSLSAFSPVGIFQLDRAGDCVYANPRLLDIAGLTDEEEFQRNWRTCVHPDDTPVLAHAWAEGTKGNGAFSCRFRYLRPDGEVRWLWVHAAPMRDRAGQATGYVGTTVDITRYETMQSALRASEQRWRQIVETAAEGIWIIDTANNTVFVNHRLAEMLGTTVEEMLASPPAAFLPREAVEQLRPEKQRWRLGETEHFEVCFLRRDNGKRAWAMASLSPLRDDGGAITGAMGMLTDITGRRAAEEQLRASEEKYRRTFEALDDIYFECDADGRLTIISPSCLARLGYAPSELMGSVSRRLYADEAAYRALADLFEREGGATAFEAAMVRKDGTLLRTAVDAVAVRNEDGTLAGYRGTVRDISERKRLERERDRMFTLSLDMLAVVDVDNRIVRVNSTWEQVTGFPERALLGHRPEELMHEDDRDAVRAAFTVLGHGEPLLDRRYRLRCADGKYRWVAWNATPPGRRGYAYCVVRDVEEEVQRREHERELLAALESSTHALQQQAEELDRLRREAEYAANHDALTGVMNRRAWFGEATHGRYNALAIFDIDHFKHINDRFGHPAGDEALRQVARRLTDGLGSAGVIGRIGGEEFGALVRGSMKEASEAAAAALEAVAGQPILLPWGGELRVSISCGLAPWRRGGNSREASLAATYEAADRALYDAKRAGRARVVVRLDSAA